MDSNNCATSVEKSHGTVEQNSHDARNAFSAEACFVPKKESTAEKIEDVGRAVGAVAAAFLPTIWLLSL